MRGIDDFLCQSVIIRSPVKKATGKVDEKTCLIKTYFVLPKIEYNNLFQ